MVWDATKSSGDLIQSSDWNDLVSVMKRGAITLNLSTHQIDSGNHAELGRFNLPAGTTIKVHASGIDPSGTTDLNVVVRNVTDSTDIYSNNSETNIGPDLASGGDGDIVEIRIDNSTDSAQDASGWCIFEISSV